MLHRENCYKTVTLTFSSAMQSLSASLASGMHTTLPLTTQATSPVLQPEIKQNLFSKMGCLTLQTTYIMWTNGQ